MRTNPRQCARLTRCDAIERAYSDPSTCQTIASARITSVDKRSYGQCGSL